MANGGKARLSEEMRAAVVCERMGWTYQQYIGQPVRFVDSLLMKWSAQAEAEQSRKNNG